MKLGDFKGLFNKSIATIQSVENPHGDYYIVKMKPAQNLKWEAGEHGIFTLPGKDIDGKKWRAFSVASIDNDGYIMIGTRTGKEVSSFKKNLINMKKGEKVAVRGPFGWFKIMDNSTPMVLVAHGVGITPIRALLKRLEKNTAREIHVIYASSDYYLFGDDIDRIAEGNQSVALYKTKDREATQKQLKALADKFSNTAYYYISGSIPATKADQELLKQQAVKGSRIINDPFYGY